MYYKLSHFYKRDISFAYSEEQNPISWLDFRTGKKINTIIPLVFKVDKLDDYINTFDILPTIGVPLVSYKFKELFLHLSDSMEIEFFPTNIIDNNGNNNDLFFALNILHVVPCLDKE